MKITCSLSSFIKIVVFALLTITALCFWIHAEIKIYEIRIEQKWMNFYYERTIEFQKNQLSEPISKDDLNESGSR